MLPLSQVADPDTHRDWMISDSWYIGAFGKWWRGGVLEAWYQDVISRSKDEESWTSGILNMKRLDMSQAQDCNVSKKLNGSALPPPRHPAPRLRNRDRPAPKCITSQLRNSSPPPLPKSASLPMHSKKPLLIIERDSVIQPQLHLSPLCQPVVPDLQSSHASRAVSATSSSPISAALLDQSPLVADILHQINATKTSIVDLRSQLVECHSASSQSHAMLQHELNNHKDKKRLDDAAKLELKSRTKTLEDTKRAAESVKKEADKKFKSVQSSRDHTAQRVSYLEQEISTLRKNLAQDRELLDHHQTPSEERQELTQALEFKRQEIKDSEDAIVSLNRESRALEDRLAAERQKLQLLRERSKDLRQSRSSAIPQLQPWALDSGFFDRSEGYVPLSLEARTSPTSIKQGLYGLSEQANDHHHSRQQDSYQFSERSMSAFKVQEDDFASNWSADDYWPAPEWSDLLSTPGSQDSFSLPSLGSNFPIDGGRPAQPSFTNGTTLERKTKGLNPDAKEFNLAAKPAITATKPLDLGLSPYDALNPNGPSPRVLGSSTDQLLLQAFAPSPEERRALQMALHGSANFEKLPNLSVGGIPSVKSFLGLPPLHEGVDGTIPEWLEGFSRGLQPSKVKFSPWEDEDVCPNGVSESRA